MYLGVIIFFSFQATAFEFARPDFVEGKITMIPAHLVAHSPRFCFWIFDDVRVSSDFERQLNSIVTSMENRVLKPLTEHYFSAFLEEEDDNCWNVVFDNIRDQAFWQGKDYGKNYRAYVNPELLGERTVLMDLPRAWDRPEQLYSRLAHELMHLIGHQIDPLEETFLEEGLAELMEYSLFGQIPFLQIEAFYNFPTRSLTDFNQRPQAAYGQNFLFMAYVKAHFGSTEFILDLLNDQKLQGMLSLGKTLQDHLLPSFEFIWRHFSLALLLNTDRFSKRQLFYFPGLSDQLGQVARARAKAGSFVVPAYSQVYLRASGQYELTLPQDSPLEAYLVFRWSDQRLHINSPNDWSAQQATRPTQATWVIVNSSATDGVFELR